MLKAIPLIGTWLFAGPFADLTRAWQNGLIHELLPEADSSDEYTRIRPLLRYVVVGATIMVNMLLNMASVLKRVLISRARLFSVCFREGSATCSYNSDAWLLLFFE